MKWLAMMVGVAVFGSALQKNEPIVLKMKGRQIIAQGAVSHVTGATGSKSKHMPTGWQPGGPLRPLFQQAVRAIHARDFDGADSLCRRGLALAPGDKAFTDLEAQIPAWRRDTAQARITDIYNQAVALTRERRFDEAEAKCRAGLALEPDNGSFRTLERDIAKKRDAALQFKLLQCYRRATTLLSQGRRQEAEDTCRDGLKLKPDDPVLKALLRRIQAQRD